MRKHKCLLVTALLIASEIVAVNLTADAQPKTSHLNAKNKIVAGSGARFPLVTHKGGEPLEQAYQDAFNVVSKNNSCTRFFGTTSAAVEALNRLVAQLQLHPLRDNRTGIHMSGNFTYFEQAGINGGFRLFATATINTRGPFFKAKAFPTEPHVPPVGSYLPNTREARVLMLLHELAHLVKGPEGRWLIPDDGNAPALSARNTALIEAQCRRQVLPLSLRACEPFVWNEILWRSNWS